MRGRSNCEVRLWMCGSGLLINARTSTERAVFRLLSGSLILVFCLSLIFAFGADAQNIISDSPAAENGLEIDQNERAFEYSMALQPALLCLLLIRSQQDHGPADRSYSDHRPGPGQVRPRRW